jgi:hypothetical protein
MVLIKSYIASAIIAKKTRAVEIDESWNFTAFF